MSNPVLSARGVFTPAQPQYVPPAQGVNGNPQGVPGGYQQYAPQPGYQPGPQGYGPATWQPPAQPVERMTIDDVLQKTAISLGLLFLVAAFAYFFLPDQILYPVGIVGGLVAFVAPFIVARRRVAGPAGNVVYAIAEGLLVGAFSKIFELVYPGIVVQAVLGTLVAAGVVLVAYRFGGFRISSRGAKIVRTGLLAFCGVALVNLVLVFFNINLGLFPGPGQPVSLLAWVFALLGVGLAVFSLVEDFQFIEAGVRMGAPREQGWVAAFGLSVTMVWLYINLLRIIGYIRH
ncbi:MAG: Bax inhibitor-1/YccA family protein [Propionibacteriaceae bacterium]|nr:Bax inhibitor-1/YccA family protein [Propionibacteriaceae bacterium]